LKESGAPSKSDGTKASDSDENTDETSPPSSRLAVRPFARSDFELFAEDAAGHPLEVYGRRLFDEVPTTFAPMDRIPVPADYALGPGDQLRVRVWGKVELEFVTTIDRNGQISVPKVGSLAVAGLRYEELEGFLRKAIGNLYTGFEINVSLGRLRSIQIFVLGSARQPGAYTVSSLSTLVDALFASGGPSATGTMRRIQLRRSDHPTAELDVYDLLRKGDKSHDVQLLPGDVIYIPPVGPQVAIVANVNEPGIYELKGETTIASVLEAAGGLTNLAGMDRALLERVENRRRRRVDEFPLDALEKSSLISISVTDHDKSRAADMANAYTEILRDLTKSVSVSEASRRRLSFEQQLQEAKESLVTAELAFQQVQQSKGLVHLDAQSNVVIGGLASVRANIAQKEVELQTVAVLLHGTQSGCADCRA
jgi:protein involved in polysaccharide export with SLBB domain